MIRTALIQLRSGTVIQDNLDAASVLIRQAASDGATFIATPEMTHILQRAPKHLFESILDEANDLGVMHFSDLAKELSIDLLIGSLAIKTTKNRAVNRSFLFGPDGEIKARYDKIHLFDVTVSKVETWKESNVYDRGEQAVMAQVAGAKLGLSICYDLRFASLYKHYVKCGAQILTVPAAFTRPTGEAHWESLLRARAIETSSFVVAPAQGGQHEDGRATWGRSMIVGPWGDIRAKLDHDNPSYICADLDMDDVVSARSKIPAWDYQPEYKS